MTTPQHTSGEWKVIQGANRIVESVEYGKIALMDTQRLEYEANAQLIAAAPELLEALQKAQNALADAFNLAKIHNDRSSADRYDRAFNKVTEAIAKAEGHTR